MEEALGEYEQKRTALIDSLKEMGDFRRGTITVNYRKCGKTNCACAQPGHPGHGPQYLWSATIKGKSYARNLKLGHEMQKDEEETARHRRFVKLCDEIVQINERICDLRPVPEVKDDQELAVLKKKLWKRFMKKYKGKSAGS
jgi:hypothetical protein